MIRIINQKSMMITKISENIAGILTILSAAKEKMFIASFDKNVDDLMKYRIIESDLMQ